MSILQPDMIGCSRIRLIISRYPVCCPHMRGQARSATTSSAGSAPEQQVAVLGAGLAGSACARALADVGVKVSLFDQGSRGPGRSFMLKN